MQLGLQGKKAIVTGASRGIGRAIAELLASEGCDLAICSRNQEQLDAALTSLSAKGVKAVGATVDVADLEAQRRWIAGAGEALGGIDIFVANVSALAQGMDEASWRAGLDTDLMATVFGIEAALPLIQQSTAGAIVVVGTTGAVEVAGPPRAYASVKAALAPKNVRANMVSPGNVYFTDGIWNKVEVNNPEAFRTALSCNPMGRMGTPEEVANAVVFLASPAASFISGTNIIVDGAMTQRVQF